MSRLLLIIAIVAVVYLLIRHYRQAPKQTSIENMVSCAYCGLHLPGSESINSDGRFFCGVEHRDAYRK